MHACIYVFMYDVRRTIYISFNSESIEKKRNRLEIEKE